MATTNESKALSSDKPFESDLMQAANIESLNIARPRDVDSESAKPRLQTQVVPINRKEPETEKRAERKPAVKTETAASDMFLPFMRNTLISVIEPTPSFFVPSSIMMFYIIHEMDYIMCQNYYFNRSTMYYHPYISRLYFSILFYIQVLRAMNKAGALERKAKLFLEQFMDDFPPESLSIPGPLIPFFQAIAVTQPNDTNMGKVYPYVPTTGLGPRRTSDRIVDTPSRWLLPNVPLLYGFIARITSQEAKASATTNGSTQTIKEYPSPWNPLLSLSADATTRTDVQPTINGTPWSSDPNNWDDTTAWSLSSPGVNYPVESNDEQNKKFTKYGSQLRIPPLDATSNTSSIANFLQLDEPEWFGKILTIMTLYSKYFRSSGTLAQCSPETGSSTRITVTYEAPKATARQQSLVKPRVPGDDDSRFPLVFTSRTTEYGISQYNQMLAHYSQLNAEVFESHPKFPNAGTLAADDKDGPFWTITPVSHESMRDTGYLQVSDVIADYFALEKAQN